jgi:hypothetical protein
MNRSLIELEWSRYRSSLPGWKGDALGRLALYGALIMGGIIALLLQRPDAGLAYAFAAAAAFALVIYSMILFMLENMRRADPIQQWWLQLPYDRLTLTIARFRGYCGVGGIAAVMSIVFAMLGYAAALAWRGGEASIEPVSMAVLLAIAGIGLAGVPVIVAWGMSISVLFRRRWYWVLFLVLYLIFTFGVGPSGLGVLLVAEMKMIEAWLSAERLSYVLLGTVGIGWPTAYGLLKLTARFGLANLADPRNAPAPDALHANMQAKPGSLRRSVRKERAITPFRALYEMERGRLGVFVDRLVVRILFLACMIALAVGGYYAYGHSEAILMAPTIITGCVSYIVILYLPITIGQDIQGKKLDWWLALPLPRWKMMMAKMYAHWRIALLYVAGLFGSMWLGLLGRVMLDETATLQGLAMDAEWLAYELLLGCCLFVVTMSYFLGSTIINNAYPKSAAPVVLLIFLPIIYREQIANYYIAELSRLAEVTPYWDRLLWTALAAAAVSIAFLLPGTLLLNRLAGVRPKEGNWLFGLQKRV